MLLKINYMLYLDNFVNPFTLLTETILGLIKRIEWKSVAEEERDMTSVQSQIISIEAKSCNVLIYNAIFFTVCILIKVSHIPEYFHKIHQYLSIFINKDYLKIGV